GAAADHPPQSLTAPLLVGNTIKQEYSLNGPVQLLDPAEGIRFDGTDLRLQAKEEQLRSDKPFVARRGTALARGDGLVVEGRQQTVEIPVGCWLEQPGESLRARRCRWNWSTQAIEAEGAVQVERPGNRQSLRGERLVGMLGPRGRLELTSPGGRVVSRFAVPRRQGRAPDPAPRRRAPEPIRL
ncbi:MAG: hypothetical protein ACKOZW_14090, partial [Cyanobium sp.]